MQSAQPSIEQESDTTQEQVTHAESASQLDDVGVQEQVTHAEVLTEAHKDHCVISPDAISR